MPFDQEKELSMRFKLLLSVTAAVLSVGLLSTSAMASGRHHIIHHNAQYHKLHRLSVSFIKRENKPVNYTQHHKVLRLSVAHNPKISPATRANVQAIIKSQAPHYGVPTWFALRIAKIESGFNPMVTGSVGEIGVFQLKCQTARGIGYSGPCAGLYNASTNVKYGLKYLSMAVKSSHGNMRLAASKHNGGLGRKSLVPRYVAMVF